MNIPPLVLQALTGLEPLAAAELDEARRETRRIPITLRVQVKTAAGVIPGVIREISVRGISLMITQALEIDADLKIFISRLGQPPAVLRGRVTRCTPGRNHIYIVGLAFTGFISTAPELAPENPIHLSEQELTRIRAAFLS